MVDREAQVLTKGFRWANRGNGRNLLLNLSREIPGE